MWRKTGQSGGSSGSFGGSKDEQKTYLASLELGMSISGVVSSRTQKNDADIIELFTGARAVHYDTQLIDSEHPLKRGDKVFLFIIGKSPPKDEGGFTRILLSQKWQVVHDTLEELDQDTVFKIIITGEAENQSGMLCRLVGDEFQGLQGLFMPYSLYNRMKNKPEIGETEVKVKIDRPIVYPCPGASRGTLKVIPLEENTHPVKAAAPRNHESAPSHTTGEGTGDNPHGYRPRSAQGFSDAASSSHATSDEGKPSRSSGRKQHGSKTRKVEAPAEPRMRDPSMSKGVGKAEQAVDYHLRHVGILIEGENQSDSDNAESEQKSISLSNEFIVGQLVEAFPDSFSCGLEAHGGGYKVAVIHASGGVTGYVPREEISDDRSLLLPTCDELLTVFVVQSINESKKLLVLSRKRVALAQAGYHGQNMVACVKSVKLHPQYKVRQALVVAIQNSEKIVVDGEIRMPTSQFSADVEALQKQEHPEVLTASEVKTILKGLKPGDKVLVKLDSAVNASPITLQLVGLVPEEEPTNC